MTAHDALCACTLREHSCGNNWAGTHCTKCECHKIARVRADERERNGEMNRIVGRDYRERLRAQVEALPERGVGDVIRKADVLALLKGGAQ